MASIGAYSGDADHSSDLMAITIPSDADYRRSEATLAEPARQIAVRM
ncbi:MAG: hypothetical protein ACLQU1_32520 [Bryobacteraceae bacterium]